MGKPITERMLDLVTLWLMSEPKTKPIPYMDFDRIKHDLKPGDVILIEGRARVSEVIKIISQSSWSHACLYLGRLDEIENPILRARVQEYYKEDPSAQLLVESELGRGVCITPVDFYAEMQIRICRPRGLSQQDAQHILGYAIGLLGSEYDVQQVIDLARFLLPWGALPKRWRSSLFQMNAGTNTRAICSSMIAEAFTAVNFPILPHIKKTEHGFELVKRNPKLYAPRDFDYSPFFDIIKYPFIEVHEDYNNLPWTKDEGYSQDLPLNQPEKDFKVLEAKERRTAKKRKRNQAISRLFKKSSLDKE